MTAPTHIGFISSLYIFLSAIVSYPIDAAHLGILSAASLLPDIDYPNSWIGKVFTFLSERIERRFGHRTITHSVTGCAILAVLSLPLFFISKQIYFLLQLGYFSHIALDMWTKTGVPFLWPFLKEHSFVFPGVKSWRIEVGSKPEVAVCVFYVLSSLSLYNFQAMGYDRILSLLIKDISFAKKDFNKYSPKYFTNLKGEFKDNITLKIIKAEYPAIALNKDGLLVLDGSQLRIVSKTDSGHLHPNRVYIDIKEPIQTFAPKINLDARTIADLIANVDSDVEHYIIGEAILASRVQKIPDKSDSFNPLYISNNKIQFRYATLEDLKPFSSMLLKKGEVTIQYRLRQNEQVQIINVNNDHERTIQTPIKITVRDLDNLKVVEGDAVTKGQIIAQDPAIESQIERKEAELRALEADWNAKKLEIKKRKNEIEGKINLTHGDEELEKLKNIFAAKKIKKMKQEREQLKEAIPLLDEQLNAKKESYNASRKKIEIDINQFKEKMYIESPVSGKVAAINILNITGDKTNLEIIIISKDPFQKSKVISSLRLINNNKTKEIRSENKISKLDKQSYKRSVLKSTFN